MKVLKNLSALMRQGIYRKGIEEGFVQGYWKAKNELEGHIREMKVEMEDMRSKVKVHEDQINLLGRLVNQLTEKQSALNKETREIVDSMHKVLNTKEE